MVHLAESETLPVPSDENVAGVRALRRGIELMLRIGMHPEGVSLQQLTDELGYSKSTVHRLLATLELLEVVERDAVSRLFRPGRRTREFLHVQAEPLDPRRAALPFMASLRDESGETVTLHARTGSQHVVVEQCESREEVRRIQVIGQSITLFSGATGKAILAFLPFEERANLREEASASGIVVPGEGELEDIRKLGYSLSVAERLAGGLALSAPVFTRGGRVWGALSASGPLFRFTPARATRSAPALLESAEAISSAMGYSSLEGKNVTASASPS